MTRHKIIFAAIVFSFMTVGCADDEPKSNNQTAGDVGQDAMIDTGNSDAGVDATTGADTGPDPEFFADYELRIVDVDDSLPQFEFLVVLEGTNNGPDNLVIETCDWVATRNSDDEILAEGQMPLCGDCNPIESGDSPIDSAVIELEPGANPGTVPATLSVTCLPTGLYEDTDPSNNTLTDTFTY